MHAPAIRAHLARVADVVPVIDLAPFRTAPISFAGDDARDYATLPDFTRAIADKLRAADATLGYGGYLERRPFYSTTLFGAADPEPRDVHLGVDLWCPAGTVVRAPLGGTVEAVANNDRGRDYGGTVILRHEPEGLRFWTLYGHLGLRELDGLRTGQQLRVGTAFARVGDEADNGGWPPHLHVQVMTDLLDYVGDFPGVCRASEVGRWSKLVLDAGRLCGG